MRYAQYLKADESFDTTWYVEQEQRIAAAPASRHHSRADIGHLYVIAFDSGTTKVGKAVSPKSRLATHARDARMHGHVVTQSWTSEVHPENSLAERELINFCRTLGTCLSGEYFTDIPFDAACAFAEVEVGKRITAWFVRRDDERSTYLRSLIDAVDGDMNATWAAAREALGEPDGGA